MFYIKPPKGLITLHTLEEVVISRLEYLNRLNNDDNYAFEGNFEYLLQGSAYDCIGHFTLRFLASKSDELFSYWIQRETLLLKQRLSLIEPKQLYRLFKTISKHINRRGNDILNPVINDLLSISHFYLQPEVFKHISKEHSKDCTAYKHKIDFQFIPDLVETKAVDIFRGIATFYCYQLKEILQSLFQTFIFFEMKCQDSLTRDFLVDPRLNALYQKIQSYVLIKGYKCERVTAHNIDNESYNFPPCMMHLHLQLRHKHRLSHYARFYYTLFLKECGMTLEDALTYWKYEYSKPHICNSVCTHDWQTDNKKFIYSIRHMYGLEGGRKNYSCPNCYSIKDQISGTSYEGGCPFFNFDQDKLESLLCKTISKEDFKQFMEKTSKLNPQSKCANFFKLKNTTTSDNDIIIINNPVEYYVNKTRYN